MWVPVQVIVFDIKKSVLRPAFFYGILYGHVTDECLFARVTLPADVAELADAPDLGSGIF